MKVLLFVACLIINSSVMGITHEKKIVRPVGFQTVSGSSFDLNNYDASLVKYVTPVPLKTLVETLRIHSEPVFKNFSDAFKKAVSGAIIYTIGTPYEKVAQNELNILLHDYLPMNEADAAAAKYLLSLSACAIRKTEKMSKASGELTACQYYGAKILAEIIKRLSPMHNMLTTGLIDPGLAPSVKKQVRLTTPPELISQILKITSLFEGEEIVGFLEKTDPTVVSMWNEICQRAKSPESYSN